MSCFLLGLPYRSLVGPDWSWPWPRMSRLQREPYKDTAGEGIYVQDAHTGAHVGRFKFPGRALLIGVISVVNRVCLQGNLGDLQHQEAPLVHPAVPCGQEAAPMVAAHPAPRCNPACGLACPATCACSMFIPRAALYDQSRRTIRSHGSHMLPVADMSNEWCFAPRSNSVP